MKNKLAFKIGTVITFNFKGAFVVKDILEASESNPEPLYVLSVLLDDSHDSEGNIFQRSKRQLFRSSYIESKAKILWVTKN